MNTWRLPFPSWRAAGALAEAVWLPRMLATMKKLLKLDGHATCSQATAAGHDDFFVFPLITFIQNSG